MIARCDMPDHYIPMMNIEDYRAQFPILDNGIYLNHAAIGPWPECAANAVAEFARENTQFGPVKYAQWVKRESTLREQLARLCGAASAHDIALLKNTTEGICAVAYGLDWRPGEEIILPAGEFPSNRLPWQAQESSGAVLKEVDIRVADPEAALINAMGSRTRLLSVSAVQWSDGLGLDLQRLGEACQQRGILFFVDAIQQLGALPINVQKCRIDALCADAHKWLLGPEGIAVFFCSEPLREQLQLKQVGWHMYDNPWNFSKEDRPPSSRAVRFEAGSPNTLGQVAFHASLGLMESVGWDTIEKRVLENTEFLRRSLAGLNKVDLNIHGLRSGIVSFQPRTVAVRALHKTLAVEGVSCAVRDGCIRVSPHFYQDERELEPFVRTLSRLL